MDRAEKIKMLINQNKESKINNKNKLYFTFCFIIFFYL